MRRNAAISATVRRSRYLPVVSTVGLGLAFGATTAGSAQETPAAGDSAASPGGEVSVEAEEPAGPSPTVSLDEAAYFQDLSLPPDLPSASAAVSRLLTEAPSRGLFRLGPFDVYPSATASFYYDDNVRGGGTVEEQDDFYFTLSPGLSVVAADRSSAHPKSLALSYFPAFRFYLDQSDLNSIDHSARLQANWASRRVSLGLGQSFTLSTYPFDDVGTRTERANAATRLTSNIGLGFKTYLEVNGAFSTDIFESDYTSSRDYSNDNWLGYRATDRIDLGLGFIWGYVDVLEDTLDGPAPVAINPDQTYEQIRVRGGYSVTDRINVGASVGVELRQYEGGVDDSANPVWDVTASYQPRLGTSLGLSAYQRFSSSAYSATQNYLGTGVAFSASQRLHARLSGSISASYSHSDYQAIIAGQSASRTDDIVSFNASLNTVILPRWTAGAFYTYQLNSSNEPSYDYDRNMVGIRTSFAF